MKKCNVPKTPFATRLSGSAKETELRIRNIFQWKKKRPPVVVCVLVAILLLAACGNLVGFEAAEPEIPPLNELVQKQDEPQGAVLPVEDDFPSAAQTEAMYIAQYTLHTAQGRELTVALETVALDRHNVYEVKEIKVYDGEQLLQTMETAELDHLADESTYLYDGIFLVTGYEDDYYGPKIYDFNFDGSEDIALLTTAIFPRNIPFAYFLWNEETQQLEYSFMLFTVSLDSYAKQVIEWNIINAGYYREDYYEFDADGQLQLVDSREHFIPGISESSDSALHQQFLEYFQTKFAPDKVYWQDDVPANPKEGDVRLISARYLCETRMYEVMSRAYEIEYGIYIKRGGELNWQQAQNMILIVNIEGDGFFHVLGSPDFPTGGMDPEVIVKRYVWGVMDEEVVLFRDGYPNPAGPGSQIPYYNEAYDGPETVDVLEGWEPIYWEGDYWARHSWEGVEALCYHDAPGGGDHLNGFDSNRTTYYTVSGESQVVFHSVEDGGYSINTLETTRTDLYTYRGIRVGSSRQDVQAAYSELKSGDYWGKYPGEDILWYCSDPNDFGPALLFFFENDTVSHIVLTNMFN